MAIQNDFISTIHQLYFLCSDEKRAYTREMKMIQYFEDFPIANYDINTYQEKVHMLLFLKRLFEKFSFYEVYERFGLLRNTALVLMSKKKISPCFASYIDEIVKTLEHIMTYHIHERMVLLLSLSNFDIFQNLFEIQALILDTSSMPWDLLLGTNIYDNPNLLQHDLFLFYDFMSLESFEERDHMESRLKGYGKPIFEENIANLQSILRDMPENNEICNMQVQKMLQICDSLLQKIQRKKRVRKDPNSSYEYYNSLV